MIASEVSRVVVIGAGQMGAGIAQVCAGAGMLVALVDVSVERATAGKAGIDRQLKRLAEKGKTTLEANLMIDIKVEIEAIAYKPA